MGTPHSGPSPVGPEFLAKRRERWQERVIELVTAIPEPSGATAFVENVLNEIDFEIEGDIKPADKKALTELINQFDKGRAGMLIWQVGECYPSWKVNEDGDIEWEVHSPVEVEAKTGQQIKVLGPDDKHRTLQDDERIFRLWRKHPAKKYKAWSPHMGIIDTLEAMYLHQLSDTAVATSRLAGAGILYWPTDLPSMPLKDGRPEEGSREQLNEELTRAMMQSIDNRKTADAVVPIIVYGDPSLGENHKPAHILMERPDDAQAWSTRMEAYALRYARGVELPIETVKGQGAANHWTAWVIKEDQWRFYVKPLAEVLTKALTKNFLRPTLIAMGYPVDVVKNIKIIPDGTAVIEKPDKTDAALRLKQMNVISDEAAIRESGLNPATDKASAEEQARGQVRLKDMPANFRDTTPSG